MDLMQIHVTDIDGFDFSATVNDALKKNTPKTGIGTAFRIVEFGMAARM